MKLENLQTIYFIGIGGIGMSALARYFNKRGSQIYGYDLTKTELTRQLSKEGMQIHYEEDVAKIPSNLDIVVYTPAIPADHEELVYLRNTDIPILKRSEVLGIISRAKKTIAVAGTHGKTTTSAMITHVLKCGGIDCTAFLGGISGNFNSNFVHGEDDWVVVEADEFDRSFLQLNPKISVVLSMDPDHLDIYGSREAVKEGYDEFVKKLQPGGDLILNDRIENTYEELNVMTYGFGSAQTRAQNVTVKNGKFAFDIQLMANEFTEEESRGLVSGFELAMPGRHNVENATAAFTVGYTLGIELDDLRKGINTFKGVKRRFEILYQDENITFIDDYAHHPEELRAAIDAAREMFPDKKLTGIFQPHLFSRTNDFATGFAESLDKLDECFLLEIYPAREKPIPGVSSELIFSKMKLNKKQMTNKKEIIGILDQENTEVLITMGAGDIDTILQDIIEWAQA